MESYSLQSSVESKGISEILQLPLVGGVFII